MSFYDFKNARARRTYFCCRTAFDLLQHLRSGLCHLVRHLTISMVIRTGVVEQRDTEEVDEVDMESGGESIDFLYHIILY